MAVEKIILYDSQEEDRLTEMQDFCFDLGFRWSWTSDGEYINQLDGERMFVLAHKPNASKRKYILTHLRKENYDEEYKNNMYLYDFRLERKYIFYMLEKYYDISVDGDMKVYFPVEIYNYLKKIEEWVSLEKDKDFINNIRMKQWYYWKDRKRLNTISSNYRHSQKMAKTTDEFLKTL